MGKPFYIIKKDIKKNITNLVFFDETNNTKFNISINQIFDDNVN
jgi:hypothetical protein